MSTCTDGERAAPPEDCGGPAGYADLLATLADTPSPQHAEMLDWVGGDFDSEALSLPDVNRRLARLG